jgi:multidrug transporter EmrE-like cation transporter
VTKVFVTTVGHGLSEVLSNWTIYVLIASALVGFVLQQSALKTGVLAPAMASSNAVTLFGSLAFGSSVFGESLSSGGARPTPAVVGLGVALVGIVLLAGPKPPQASQGLLRLDELLPAEGTNRPRPSGL